MAHVTAIACLCALLLIPSGASAGGIFVDKRSQPAKGTKTCRLEQTNSAYQQQQGNPYARSPKVTVEKSGAIQIGIGDETFPGTKVYFLIDGNRYIGDAGYLAHIDQKGLAALKKDALIQFTYTRWPNRAELSGADILAGFAAAYDECLQFLRS